MFASPLFWQIRYLVTNLSKKNLKSSISELNQLIELYGEDARLFFLQCLVEETGFKEQKAHAHHGHKDAQKIQLLQHEIAHAADEPNFVSAICRALEGSGGGGGRERTEQSHGRHASRGGVQGQQGPHRITEEFLAGFCRALKLSPAQQVAVALGLSRSCNPGVAKEGVKFLIARVPGLAAGGGGTGGGGGGGTGAGQLSLEALHSLFELVNHTEDVSAQPHLGTSLLQQIREAHQELLAGLEGESGKGNDGGGGFASGGSSSGGNKSTAGGDAVSSATSLQGSTSTLSEADVLALVPLFTDHTGEMNFLNKTSGAMSLTSDVAGIANSIGQGGSLAGFLKDLGHTCCSSPAALRQAIRESGVVVDERQVAQLITMLANNYNSPKGGGDDGDLSTALTNSLFSSGEGQMAADAGRDGGSSAGQGQGLWKLEVARQVLAEDYGPRLDWIAVARALDHDRFNIPDQNALRVLLALYRGPAGRDIPSEALYMPWDNRRGQLSLLRAAIQAPPQVFTFTSSPAKQAPLEDVDPTAATPNGAWLSLDLVAALLSLASDTELYAQVRDVFSKPAYQCPELLLLALAAVPSEAGGNLRVEMLSRLLPLYFRPNRNTHAASLIRRLWQVNPRLVVQSGVKAFNVDSTLPSVVYVLRIMRLVPDCAAELLGSDDCAFAIAVASVAYGAEVPATEQQPSSALYKLDLENWVCDRLTRKDRELFAAKILSFVQSHLPTARLRHEAQKPGDNADEGPLPTCAMSIEAAAIFIKVLGGTGKPAPAAEPLLNKNPALLQSATQLFEAAKNMHPGMHHVMDTEEEVEDIANAYFQRIYTSEQSIEEVIVMLQRFKSSSDPREQEIFACMVHNLFDEYRFYHNYPEPELCITGILFGSLIQHQLVSSITLGIALRYVLEALRKPPAPDRKGRMFRFGMFALEQFKGRLGEWPQYCSHMIQIPHLVANHPALVREIEESMQRPPDRLPPTAVAPGPPKVAQPDGPRQLPQIVPVGGGLVRQQSGPGPDGGGGGAAAPGAVGASPVMRGEPSRSMPQGQATPDRNVGGTGGGQTSVGRSPGGSGLGGNDQALQGHGMGGLGGILGGVPPGQGAPGTAGGAGGAGPAGAQLQGGGPPTGAGNPGQMGNNLQQQAGGRGGGEGAPGAGGALQSQLGQQLPGAGAPSRSSPDSSLQPQQSPFTAGQASSSRGGVGAGGVGATSAFGGGAAGGSVPGNPLLGGGGGGAAPGTDGEGKGGAGGSGAVGRLGPELGLASVLGLPPQGQDATGLAGQQGGGGGVGNVGGGVAAGAPGHETWGTGAGGQALPQAGGQAGASAANGPAPAPTGALPPKQPEGLGTPNMDQLMAKVEEPTALTNPPEAVMDRIHFVVNNVTANNLPQKVSEIKSHVQNNPDYHPWLANYLVVKRICTQPNFHDLYLELVNQLETPSLMEAILKNVFYNISKLLRSQKIITSTSERSLLKNLGSWLGKITLGRDKPVLQRELDMKELLFQGYETGRLIAVTPFVAKILEGAPSGKSRVFKPPNPWIMGLFSALHEMYELQDLKMNIKFEIEMLCQKFNVTLADVPMYGRLSTRMTPSKEKNPDFNSRARAAAEQPQQQDTSANTGDGSAGPGGARDAESGGTPGTGNGRGGARDADERAGAAGVKQPADQQTVIPNLASYVTINPSLEIFATQPQLKEVLKRVVPVAVDRAIREIIQPVVERSVTIACITSKELVQKDFAMEADENKMRKAAHLMVSNLAGSLALVTCKEPLRVSIGNHMRSLLATGAPHADQGTTEMLVQLCSSENLELGCMLIEKAATEKAMRDIDEAVAGSLQQRRKSRETTGQPFYDMSIFNSLRYPGALPDALRPKPGGLHPQQLLVYEAFQRVPRQPTVNSSPAGPSGMAGPGAGGPAPSSPHSPALNSAGGPGGARAGVSPKGVELTLEQALQAWQGAITRLDMAIGGLLAAQRRAGGGPELTLHAANRDQDLSAALQEIVTVGKSVPVRSREEALTKFARAVFGRLFDMARSKEDDPAAVPMLRVEVYAAVLELCLRTVKTSLSSGRKEDLLSQWYTSLPPQALVGAGSRKLHLGAMKYLVQMNMVDLEKTDAFLARNISLPNQNQQMASQEQLQLQDEWGLYAIVLIRQCVFEHTDASGPDGKAYQVATMKSFAKSLETLSQLNESKRPMLAQQFLQLASELRIATHPDAQRKAGASPSMAGMKAPMGSPAGPQPTREPVGTAGSRDPAGTREEVTQLLHYWLRLSAENPLADDKTTSAVLQVFAQRKTFITDDAMMRFYRVATEIVVEACIKTGRPAVMPAGTGPDEKMKSTNTPQLSYAVVDGYVKLLLVLIRTRKAPDGPQSSNPRVELLGKVLGAIINVILRDAEARKGVTEASAGSGIRGAFDQRPYFRILLCLMQEMNKPNRMLDNSNPGVLMTFASAFHSLRPVGCPAFAFAWLELISHRSFMPNLLLVKQNKGWPSMHRLLVDLLNFMEPHLRKPSLLEPVRLLYTGMLRMLLVLLHDFPEFLCDYHLSFCDVIPPSCIQLRNLILSAFPRSMRLPDPFTPNLKVDLLPEIALAPRILSNYVAALSHNGIRADLDKFLQTRHQPVHFLAELAGKLRLSPQEAAHTGMTYNVPCINSLVVYVGSQAILQLNNKTPIITHSAPMDVFHQLANKLDPEGRYFFLNAVANQLRYPNQHTHYFSCVLLYLFAEAQSEMVQEQITRILLERLIVHRPHPWGVLITFIELIKNPRYSFWSHSFTHCAPELERVFESVARSCMTPGAAGAGAGSEEDGVAAGTAQ